MSKYNIKDKTPTVQEGNDKSPEKTKSQTNDATVKWDIEQEVEDYMENKINEREVAHKVTELVDLEVKSC
jgi:hypothetical protein